MGCRQYLTSTLHHIRPGWGLGRKRHCALAAEKKLTGGRAEQTETKPDAKFQNGSIPKPSHWIWLHLVDSRVGGSWYRIWRTIADKAK